MADHPHNHSVNIPQVDETPKHHSTQNPFSPPPPPPPPPPSTTPPSPQPPAAAPAPAPPLLPLESYNSMTTSSSSGASSSTGGKHPIYRGIRKRSGKWVSEIREPRKTTRIWLGTYPTPEMAAAAYDVAALALKGSDVILNFPDRVGSYPVPEKALPHDIRSAAGKAAAMMQTQSSGSGSGGGEESTAAAADDQLLPMAEGMPSCDEFIDEDDLLNMPNLLVHMAEGMLVSPPRIISSPVSDEYDSPGNSDAESLWGYF